jgi:type IV secretion system protein VirB4
MRRLSARRNASSGTAVAQRPLRREAEAGEHIPYTAHVDECVIRTRDGAYVQTLRLAGALFECADDSELAGWHERLNVLWRNLASPQVAVWTHLVRRRAVLPPESACPPGFAADVQTAYRGRLQ